MRTRKGRAAILAVALAASAGLLLLGNFGRGAEAKAPAPEGRAAHGPGRDVGVTPSPAPADLAAGSEPCAADIDKITSLFSDWISPLIVPGVWLHFKEKVDRADDMYVGEFPDGRPIPQDYIWETWELIGDGGLVVQGITVMYDLAGKPVQFAVFDGRAMRNLTYDVAHPQEPYPAAWDCGIPYAIENHRMSGPECTTGSRGGRPTIEIAVHEDYPAGLDLSDYPERVSRGSLRAVFDEGTGMLLSCEMLFTSEKGQEKLVWVTTVLAAEKVGRPPDDLLRLLQEVSR